MYICVHAATPGACCTLWVAWPWRMSPGACEPKWPASTKNLAEQPRIPSLLPQPERSLWLKLDVNQKYDLRADGHEAV